MSGEELHLERLIAVPPDEVFALWTEPALLASWWGPEGVDIPELSLDVTPGGRWRTIMRQSNGTRRVVSGRYLEIVPVERLVFTWAFEDETGQRGHETIVDVRFAAVPGGTRLTLVQKSFDTAENRDRHGAGWSSSFICLERVLSARSEA
jgi:uncharacterized protein YndB with AHSA1/START domain